MLKLEKKTTPRVYDGITPRVYFKEFLAWFYDGITPRLDLQPPPLHLAIFQGFALTPFSQRKENDTSLLATSVCKPKQTHSFQKVTCWVDTQSLPCAQYC